MTSDLDLLRQYAEHDSEEAFTEIVQRHLNLVYSAAWRQVRSQELAEEVTQSVFTDLAGNISKLKPNTILSAWLYQVTRLSAIDVVRRESRRQARERIAMEITDMNSNSDVWPQIEPLLEEAMETLSESERSAILLRYFESKSLKEVGEALGASEDTVQKRVSRALDKLRLFFFEAQRPHRSSRIGGSYLHECCAIGPFWIQPLHSGQHGAFQHWPLSRAIYRDHEGNCYDNHAKDIDRRDSRDRDRNGVLRSVSSFGIPSSIGRHFSGTLAKCRCNKADPAKP